MPLAIVLGFAALLVGLIAGLPRWRASRRERWASRPFPPAWRTILRRRVPLYRGLPAHLQQQLRRHIQVFLAEKPFLGCAGLEITDEIRVTVAAQACLLRLNRGGALFPELRQILVYPGAFMVDRVATEAGGVLREQRRALAGESWSQGQVILSWQDVVDGARVVDDGHNVVLHEFAHQLDQESGAANGAPRLDSRRAQARWADVMHREFDALHGRLRAREAARERARAWASWNSEPMPPPMPLDAPPELISDYGATNPAEFFAVVTEVFFEQAAALAQRHPALFEILRDYYAVDPREWLAASH
jgi:Mlc titration factor MtfA (ptsG expression regulator)